MTDYKKWEKFKLEDYGLEELPEVNEATRNEQYFRQVSEIQKHQKRLKELEAEKAKAEQRLAELEKSRKFYDKLFLTAFVIGMIVLAAATVAPQYGWSLW